MGEKEDITRPTNILQGKHSGRAVCRRTCFGDSATAHTSATIYRLTTKYGGCSQAEQRVHFGSPSQL